MNMATQKTRTFPPIFEQKEVSILRKFDALLFAHAMAIHCRRQIASRFHTWREKMCRYISNFRRDIGTKFVQTQDH
jgi:hypothetical protein